MGIFLGDVEPSKIFVWGSQVASVWAWDTKVRPVIKDAYIDFLLVAWGWAWGRSRYAYGWGGWGAWWLICCLWYLLDTTTCVTIWAWGVWSNTQCLGTCGSGCDSCFWSIVAYWGWGGWGANTAYSAWCPWADGWSWWGSVNNTCASWCSWQWKRGWKYWGNVGTWGWGGGYWSVWCDWCTVSVGCWWNGWQWLCSDISWEYVWYASGGWGGWCGYGGSSCGGWCWWALNCAWIQASCYWSWGWGGGQTNKAACCYKWWDGCQWVFIARYPANCNYNITWGTKYECNWYCIHCFTSDWTLSLW